jgi:hypothetical protein
MTLFAPSKELSIASLPAHQSITTQESLKVKYKKKKKFVEQAILRIRPSADRIVPAQSTLHARLIKFLSETPGAIPRPNDKDRTEQDRIILGHKNLTESHVSVNQNKT